MTIRSAVLIYPDGDPQDAHVPLRINQVVDLNGYPLEIPLKTPMQIVYRVGKISTREERGEEITFYYLELVRRDEMMEYL